MRFRPLKHKIEGLTRTQAVEAQHRYGACYAVDSATLPYFNVSTMVDVKSVATKGGIGVEGVDQVGVRTG